MRSSCQGKEVYIISSTKSIEIYYNRALATTVDPNSLYCHIITGVFYVHKRRFTDYNVVLAK